MHKCKTITKYDIILIDVLEFVDVFAGAFMKTLSYVFEMGFLFS